MRKSKRTAYARLLVRLLQKHGLSFLIRRLAGDALLVFAQRSAGINLAGYFQYVLGNGETARTFAKIAGRYKIPYDLIYLPAGEHPLLPKEEIRSFDLRLTRKIHFDKTLIFSNGNTLKDVFALSPELPQTGYRAAVWWWEYEDGMDDCAAGFDYIDEVVVFSDFVEKSVLKILPPGKTVTKLPYPFCPDWEVPADRDRILRRYGVDPDCLVFFFNFDFTSSIRRKNPQAVLKAFETAFHGSDRAHLVIKSTSHSWFQDKARDFQSMLSGHPLHRRITWIPETLSHDDHYELLGAIDCYVSLHRGEGMGLGMLEAMSMGKPVIASAYGGNMEFTKPNNSLLVDCALQSCDDDYIVYRRVTRWAEPDIGQAAQYMRALYQDRDKGRMLGNRARQDIQHQFDQYLCIREYKKWIAVPL